MTAKFTAPPIRVSARYDGTVVVPSRWRTTLPAGGEDAANEVRVVAPHCDGGWVIEWRRRGQARVSAGELGHTTDENLRRLFRPVGWHPADPTRPPVAEES